MFDKKQASYNIYELNDGFSMRIVHSILLSLICLIPAVGCSALPHEPQPIGDYDLCIASGGQIMKTFPPKCLSKDGKTFTKEGAIKVDPQGGNTLCKNQCGDGICQQIVCMGSECPCAETAKNCSDCVAHDF